ncbi:hypothetical protein [Parvibaculum sedimenti]|nr:hypothetical protein [Parvibaculum sedimenti]
MNMVNLGDGRTARKGIAAPDLTPFKPAAQFDHNETVMLTEIQPRLR